MYIYVSAGQTILSSGFQVLLIISKSRYYSKTIIRPLWHIFSILQIKLVFGAVNAQSIYRGSAPLNLCRAIFQK